MKIRQGFVSNSSSSSFILIGKSITKKSELLNVMEKKENKIYATGEWFESGIDLIELDKDMFEFMLESKITQKFEYYEVFIDGCEELKINKTQLPDGDFTIIALEVDHHPCESIEDLRECYVNNR